MYGEHGIKQLTPTLKHSIITTTTPHGIAHV